MTRFLVEASDGNDKSGSGAESIQCPSPNCRAMVTEAMMRDVLSPDEIQLLLHAMTQHTVRNDRTFISCPSANCQNIFQRVDDSRTTVIEKLKRQNPGKVVTEVMICKEMNRFLCRSCHSNFCSLCHCIPYHEGMTCEQYQLKITSNYHCRFCGSPVDKQPKSLRSMPSSSIICNNIECIRKKVRSCDKVLSCGHVCHGIRNESRCMPCLECASLEGSDSRNECHGEVNKSDTSCGSALLQQPSYHCANDLCNICYVETLREAPCLRLECGHVFHEECTRQKMKNMWPGARITFNFMDCPICQKEMKHESLTELRRRVKRIRRAVTVLCRKQLELEANGIPELNGMDQGERLAWAHDHYAFYMCTSCHEPYYGGMIQCEVDDDAPRYARGDDDRRRYNNNGGGAAVARVNHRHPPSSSSLNHDAEHTATMCPQCKHRSMTLDECPVHGTEYILWKCRFCCNYSKWFCWGRTHFCDECHEVQCHTRRLHKTPVDQLPKCEGPGRCRVGGRHRGNGHEFALGCAICRDLPNFHVGD